MKSSDNESYLRYFFVIFSVGEEESGTEQNASQILAAYGLTDQLVDKVNLDYTEAASELKDGEIDAFFCTAGIQTTVIGELAKQTKMSASLFFCHLF